MQDRLLKLHKVQDATSLKKSSIYHLMSLGEFPKNIKVGSRAVAWRESEIQQWINDRPINQIPNSVNGAKL